MDKNPLVEFEMWQSALEKANEIIFTARQKNSKPEIMMYLDHDVAYLNYDEVIIDIAKCSFLEKGNIQTDEQVWDSYLKEKP